VQYLKMTGSKDEMVTQMLSAGISLIAPSGNAVELLDQVQKPTAFENGFWGWTGVTDQSGAETSNLVDGDGNPGANNHILTANAEVMPNEVFAQDLKDANGVKQGQTGFTSLDGVLDTAPAKVIFDFDLTTSNNQKDAGLVQNARPEVQKQFMAFYMPDTAQLNLAGPRSGANDTAVQVDTANGDSFGNHGLLVGLNYFDNYMTANESINQQTGKHEFSYLMTPYGFSMAAGSNDTVAWDANSYKKLKLANEFDQTYHYTVAIVNGTQLIMAATTADGSPLSGAAIDNPNFLTLMDATNHRNMYAVASISEANHAPMGVSVSNMRIFVTPAP
jgi:hypothetical protein